MAFSVYSDFTQLQRLDIYINIALETAQEILSVLNQYLYILSTLSQDQDRPLKGKEHQGEPLGGPQEGRGPEGGGTVDVVQTMTIVT